MKSPIRINMKTPLLSIRSTGFSHSIKLLFVNYNIYLILFSLMLTSFTISHNEEPTLIHTTEAIWPFTKKKKSTDTITAKVSAYEKLFQKKKFLKTAKGLITLHQVEEKIYFEFPLELADSEMILSSQLEEVSDISVLHVGQQANRTLFFTISKQDSTLMLLRKNGLMIETPEHSLEVEEAIAKSNIPSIIYRTPILAYSEDSTSVVVDMTSFFLGDNNFVTSFTVKPKSEKSYISDIVAFEDNVSVFIGMTIEESRQLLSFVVKTTIYHLPSEKMPSVAADHRIGVNSTTVRGFDGGSQGVDVKRIVCKWNLQPSDQSRYESGELVTPVKPILFYVDTLFSAESFEGIKKGFEKWNGAFEKIGYKNVIKVLPYPNDDSSFNANNNVKYNCIKYIQTNRMDISRNISRQILTDPRTGEIISVSFYFPRDAFIPIHYQRVIQTAHTDPAVRDNKLTSEQMIESMTAIMMKQAGYSLGLVDNLAASSWYAVDSLRSPTFTSENGITSSVMDDVLYNYVAQPGDLERGVKLISSDLGVYDHYAIEWLYGKNSDEERLAWIDAHEKDPRYRFIGRKTTSQVVEDPRAITGTLGNNVLKSTSYGLVNCRYVMDNYINWIDKPETSESYKMLFPEFIFLETLMQFRHLVYPLGGIYIDNTSGKESFKSVSGKEQRQLLLEILDNVSNIQWMNNREAFKRSGVFYTDMTNPLIATPVTQIISRVPLVSLSAELNSDNDPFTPDELLLRLTNYATRNFRKSGSVSLTDKRILEWTIMSFASTVEKSLNPSQNSGGQSTIAIEQLVGLENPIDSKFLLVSSMVDEDDFTIQPNELYKSLDISYAAVPGLTSLYYKYLKEIDAALKYKKSITSDLLLKGYCDYYSFKIQNVLEGEK